MKEIKKRGSAPQKMKSYESFSDWKKDQSAKNQKLINSLQRLIKKIAPHLTTTVKWGQGCWVDNDKPKIYIHTEADHVQFGFYSGSSLKDSYKLLAGKGKYVRFIKIYSPEDINPKAFSDLIKQVVG